MKVAIIGAGNVGATIAHRLARAGHQAVIAVRDPERTGALLALPGVDIVAIPAALEGAEAAVLAIPGTAMDAFLAEHGARLAGRIVIDATNKIGASLGDRPDLSSVTAIASAARGARVYRAFNSLGWENFAEPSIAGIQADLLYAGPDDEGRATVEELIAGVGLRPVRVGDLDDVALVDSLAALWGALALRRGMGRRLFFKVVTP